MRVLVACEFSGVVRDAFLRHGHDAVSCDILDTESPGPHVKGDVRDLALERFDLLIAHPPCTDLAVSGARYFKEKWADGRIARALGFFRYFLDAPVERICVENPVGLVSSHIRPPDQYVQPWQFGHGETKKTGLWLKNLPPLRPTLIVPGREQRIWKEPPSPDRWKIRSRTYEGIAEAMAVQWG